MRTILRTNRIRAGLYVSLDGNWQIRRVKRTFTRGFCWELRRKQDDHWVFYKIYSTLAMARWVVEQYQNGYFE